MGEWKDGIFHLFLIKSFDFWIQRQDLSLRRTSTRLNIETTKSSKDGDKTLEYGQHERDIVGA